MPSDKCTSHLGFGLDLQQLEVIALGDGPLQVVAGPGSGKTTCIADRAANLVLTDRAKPHELALCTFTREAAREMRNRFTRTLRASGHSVLFAPAYRLVQDLLAAKRDFDLPRQLRKLDNFDFLLLDDLGYLPQANEESEVLFTLIAERYERRSLGITSNLVFSEWERIFANPMATAAAIDRVVHHAVILEFDVPSYRTDAAQQRGETAAAEEVNRQK